MFSSVLVQTPNPQVTGTLRMQFTHLFKVQRLCTANTRNVKGERSVLTEQKLEFSDGKIQTDS